MTRLFKSFQTCRKRFDYHFKSPVIKQEYEKFNQSQLKVFSKIVLPIMTFVSVVIIIMNLVDHEFPQIYINMGGLVSTLVLWGISGKIQSFINLVTMFLAVVISATGFISTKLYFGGTLNSEVFMTGNAYGIFEKIILSKIPHLSHKIFFSLAMLIVKYLIFPASYIPLIIGHILMLFLGFVVDYWRMKEDRGLFEKYHDYREGLTKFQTLMVSGLPINVLIISKDLDQEFFVNEGLKQEINNSLLQIKGWLNALTIDKETMSGNSKSATTHSLFTFEGDSLFEFLQVFSHEYSSVKREHSFTFNTNFQKDESEGSKQTFQTKVFPLKWDNQDAIVLTFNDVTEHYQNLLLKVADANKDKMLAFISHELRTPLNGILGVVQLLEKRASDVQTIQYLRVCKNSGDMLLSLVNSILDLQHIRDNRFSLKITKGNVHELLQDIFRLFKLQFDQKKVGLELDISSELPHILTTDHTRLRQVLINLIGNALKFTFEGKVEISAGMDPKNKGYVVFKVKDTGTGIKEEDKEKLFKMYGKLDQADAGVNVQGIGFGLEISNKLVKLLSDDLEGGIRVESVYGKGTQFSFLIKDQNDFRESKIYEEEVQWEEHEDLGFKVSSYKLIPTFGSGKLLKGMMSPEASKMSLRFSGLGGNDFLTIKLAEADSRFIASSQNSPAMCDSGSESKIRLMNSGSPASFLDIPISREARSRSENHDKSGGSSTTPNHLIRSVDEEEEGLKNEKKKRKKGKVLIVDDNPFNLLVGKHLVESLGYVVETALNGKLAIDEVKKPQKNNKGYDVILMDLQMPLMDGFECTKNLKKMMKDGEISEIPIIAVSANESLKDKEKCKEIGISEHVSKPLNEVILRRVLAETLNETMEID